jgi:hypothetical protein
LIRPSEHRYLKLAALHDEISISGRGLVFLFGIKTIFISLISPSLMVVGQMLSQNFIVSY